MVRANFTNYKGWEYSASFLLGYCECPENSWPNTDLSWKTLKTNCVMSSYYHIPWFYQGFSDGSEAIDQTSVWIGGRRHWILNVRHPRLCHPHVSVCQCVICVFQRRVTRTSWSWEKQVKQWMINFSLTYISSAEAIVLSHRSRQIGTIM